MADQDGEQDPHQPGGLGVTIDSQALNAICEAVKAHTGRDVSLYKATTLLRRIARRLAARRLDSAERYAALLREDAAEAEALRRELLIGVTHFFRDPSAFSALAGAVIAPLAAGGNGEGVRVWVPGCSTGEEAYSLGILFAETAAGR